MCSRYVVERLRPSKRQVEPRFVYNPSALPGVIVRTDLDSLFEEITLPTSTRTTYNSVRKHKRMFGY